MSAVGDGGVADFWGCAAGVVTAVAEAAGFAAGCGVLGGVGAVVWEFGVVGVGDGAAASGAGSGWGVVSAALAFAVASRFCASRWLTTQRPPMKMV